MGTHLGVAFKSRSGVTTLSVFLSVDVRPRLNSIPEKSTAQTGAPGTWGRLRDDDGARPVPGALCNTAHPHRGTRAHQPPPPPESGCVITNHRCASEGRGPVP